MATLPAENTYEGGSNTTTITTGNSGGGSGTAFDDVTIGASAALTYSTDQAAHGSLSAKYVNNTSTAITRMRWTCSAQTQVFGRVYLYLTGIHSSTWYFLNFQDASANSRGSLGINSGGKLVGINGAGSGWGSPTTAAMPTSQWFRVEYDWPGSTSGTVTIRYYSSMDSTSITETMSASSVNMGGTIERVNQGAVANITSGVPTFYMDDLQFNITGFPGPVSTPATGGHLSLPIIGAG